MPKDEGLIASEADFLNTELRANYGDHLQVETDDDWRAAIGGLVDGVRHGEEFKLRNTLAPVAKAWLELTSAVQQMIPTDDGIICGHVREAHRMLTELLADANDNEEGETHG